MRVAIGLALSLVLWNAGAHAQSDGQHGSHTAAPVTVGPAGRGGSANGLPLAVDGAKTPERIPDHVAYRHFLMAAAEARDASPERLADRDARLARVGLSQRDTRSLVTALKTVREELNAVAAERLALGRAAPAAQAAALKQREDDVMDGARARVRTFLSPEGRQRLERYLREQVKPHIVIYGDLPR